MNRVLWLLIKMRYTGAYCQLRNNAPLEQVQGGMGDIFIKMARD